MEPNEGVIKKLEEVLKRAREGQIQEVTVTAITDTGDAMCFYSTMGNQFQSAGVLLLAALERLGVEVGRKIPVSELEKPKVH